jgi:hypothetical protein
MRRAQAGGELGDGLEFGALRELVGYRLRRA